MYWLACLAVFVLTFGVTIVLTSIGYHRGLTHGAVRLRPNVRHALVVWGNWITGIDPQAWVIMHRLHHEHSDTAADPHSPVNVGILGVPWEQIKGYARVLRGIRLREPAFLDVAPEVPTNWLIASGFWFLPQLLHAGLAVALGWAAGGWMLGVAWWAGTMSHGLQGVIINAFGHAWGGRNFELPDNSRNNHPAAWLLLGEGFQNNHHRYPASAWFSTGPREVDPGWWVCRLFERLGLLAIERETLIPR